MITSFGRLKIVEQLDDSETQSYVVFDPERQGEVLLHVLPTPQSSGNPDFPQRLNRGLEANQKIVLARGDLFGVPYVITEYSPKFKTLIKFLEEFSMGNKPAEEARKSDDPGEFTRLFLAETPPAASIPAQLPPPAVNPPSTPREPAIDPRPNPKPQAPISATNSEAFNRYFKAPLGEGVEKVEFSKKAPPAPPEAKKPGDFTQMFGRPFSKGVKPEPADRRPEIAGATGVFSSDRSESSPPRHQSVGESEYTRIIKAPRSTSATPPLAEPQPSAADKPQVKPPSPILIFAVLGALLVFATSLVLYFVLKS